jgi:hypothetical protein
MTTATAEKITVPRPKPDEVVIAATDADGASAWVTVRKELFGADEVMSQMLPIFGDAQQILHEQRDGTLDRNDH